MCYHIYVAVFIWPRAGHVLRADLDFGPRPSSIRSIPPVREGLDHPAPARYKELAGGPFVFCRGFLTRRPRRWCRRGSRGGDHVHLAVGNFVRAIGYGHFVEQRPSGHPSDGVADERHQIVAMEIDHVAGIGKFYRSDGMHATIPVAGKHVESPIA